MPSETMGYFGRGSLSITGGKAVLVILKALHEDMIRWILENKVVFMSYTIKTCFRFILVKQEKEMQTYLTD